MGYSSEFHVFPLGNNKKLAHPYSIPSRRPPKPLVPNSSTMNFFLDHVRSQQASDTMVVTRGVPQPSSPCN